MRTLFILCFIANVLLVLFSWFVLPDQTVAQFDSAESSQVGSNPKVAAFVMLVVSVLLFAVLCLSALLVQRSPARWLSLPNRPYWVAVEHREALNRLLRARLFEYGSATFVFLFLLQVMVLQVNLSELQVLNVWAFWGLVVFFLSYLLVWCWRLWGCLVRSPAVV